MNPMPKLSLTVLLCMLVMLGGCATPVRVAPLTVDEIVTLSEAETPPEQIINHIRESRAVYRLPASELARLRDQGVTDEVIDAMQATYLEYERRRGIREGFDVFWYYDSGGFNSIRFHRHYVAPCC